MIAGQVAVLTAALLALVAAPSGAQARKLRGWPVRVDQVGVGTRTQGELIAVSSDTVWVLAGSRLVGVPAQTVARIRVKRRPIGAAGILEWGLAVGLVTGLGLTAACSSVEDTSGCEVMIPSALFSAALFSGLWAAVAGSAYSDVDMLEFERRVRPFARFPQGLPPAFEVTRHAEASPR